MTEHTERVDREALDWIRAFIDGHGYPPTVDELRDGLGYSSKQPAHQVLMRLIRSGRITKVPGQPRTIVIVEDQEDRRATGS